MPPKRTAIRRSLRKRINDAAVAAWQAGDSQALHKALGLHPGCLSPLHVDEHTAEQWPPNCRNKVGPASVPQALELQKQLYELAGPPGEPSAEVVPFPSPEKTKH